MQTYVCSGRGVGEEKKGLRFEKVPGTRRDLMPGKFATRVTYIYIYECVWCVCVYIRVYTSYTQLKYVDPFTT